VEVGDEAATTFLSLLLQGSGSQVQYPADVVMSLSEIDTQKQTSFFSHQLKVVDFLTLNTKELARSQSSQPSVCKKASSQNKQRSQPLNAKSNGAKSAKVSKTKRGAKKRAKRVQKRSVNSQRRSSRASASTTGTVYRYCADYSRDTLG